MSVLAQLGVAALRRLEPERAHALTVRALELGFGPACDPAAHPVLATTVAGLALPNPLGLAAGFDKDGRVYHPMLRAGFGFVECGTVTPLPQAGNPRPRLFRLTEDGAVINRMGFNNGGLDAFAERLTPWTPREGSSIPPRTARRRRGAGVVVANIGANKDSPDRIGDYVKGLERLWDVADAITVNISSPNTPGLRALQTADALAELAGRLDEARARLRAASSSGPPLFLKVAPDLDGAEIEAVASRAAGMGFDALIVSNTTLERPASLSSPHAGEAGGLSGAPLFARSTAVLREAATAARGTGLTLIGAGGIASGADAYAKIRAGASAVQLYTALVYGGPALVGTILADLAARLQADGFASVAEAVGA